MTRFFVIGLTAAALALAACGGAALAGAQAGKGAPQPTGVAVQVTVPPPAADGSLTAAQVTAVAERTFPLIQPYGYYGVCGLAGDLAACPYSARLKSRLGELKETLMRSQNPSGTREVTVELTSGGAGIAHVKLFGGRQALDLTVVRQGPSGEPLVDDEACSGRPGTSIYEPFAVC